MKIGVVGGGAIGLLVAGYLSEHFPVTLYVRREIQKERLEGDGLTIENGPRRIHSIHIETSHHDWNEELIILTVKQPDLPKALEGHLSATLPNQSLLFLQNGAAHLEMLDALNYEHLFIGIVEHGAWKKSDTCVVHKGVGQIKIGIVRGSKSAIEPVLSEATLHMNIVTDWIKVLNEKLLINCVINPLTALYHAQNGELIQNPYFFRIMKKVFDEAISAFDFENQEDLWRYLVQVCKNTAENRSSMLQDIEAKRATELDAIVGVVLQKANEKKVDMPILHFIYESIKGIEARNLNEGSGMI